jgi:hypothetical protein
MIFLSEIIARKTKEILLTPPPPPPPTTTTTTTTTSQKDSIINSEAYQELLKISDILRELREFKMNFKSLWTLSLSPHDTSIVS